MLYETYSEIDELHFKQGSLESVEEFNERVTLYHRPHQRHSLIIIIIYRKPLFWFNCHTQV